MKIRVYDLRDGKRTLLRELEDDGSIRALRKLEELVRTTGHEPPRKIQTTYSRNGFTTLRIPESKLMERARKGKE
jgi:hypothetical protein